jgi:histidinol dehydrogenase
MKIIEGYAAARKALARQVSAGLDDPEREKTVREIIADVRQSGDKALYDLTEKYDGVRLSTLEVDKARISQAVESIDAGLSKSLKLAAERIADYHETQRKKLLHDKTDNSLGWLVRPLERVGVYVPGGTADYPSTLLMTAIPARVAGVKEIILVTPPDKRGGVSPLTLAAAKIADVDRIFTVGGAQAIAALAFGTETIPRVDKICGPGNRYVLLAKKLLYGTVGIDGLYGPSEVIIIADDKANAAYLAADLLAQAEHDPLATAMLLTTSRELAEAVNGEIARQLDDLPRQDTAAASLEKRGMLAVVANVDEAIDLANLYAPEHLCLVVKDAADCIDKVKNTGCLFVGENAVEVLVDYVAGPSHVLPTEGTARFGSPLNILDFVKLITLVKTDDKDVARLGEAAARIARAEGLEAHARAVERRMKGSGGK